MSPITISKNRIKKEGGVVILPLKEYQRLCQSGVPTYYLEGKAAKRLDKLVEEGLKEYEKGEVIEAPSLKEALRIYDKKKNKKR